MKSPIALLTSLLIGIKRLEPDVKGLDRDIITIKARFEHEGYSFLSVALSSLCSSLDQGLACGVFTCPEGFSRIPRGTIPKLFSGMFCEVFDSKTGSLKEDPKVGIIKCLREVLMLFKKVLLDTKRGDKLHLEAVRTFWDTDEEISRISYSQDKLNLVSHVSNYILNDLSKQDFARISCKHGPGAVFEQYTPNQKWSGVSRQIQRGSFNLTKFGFDSFMVSDWDYEGFPYQETLGKEPDVDHTVPEQPYRRLAKLFSVAKNSTSRRTITAEPLMGMFIQQGLNTMLRDSISKCRILKQCLDLTDQSHNQKLALEGSLTGEWATIDLSAASDRLDSDIVKKIFSKHDLFLQEMFNCRSTDVFEPASKRVVNIRKFAGMGNALTFPTQSVVFAVIAISALIAQDGHRPTFRKVLHTARSIRVFGDDIIVPTRYSLQVVNWLESFGLKVNRKKSFMVGNFRESCGLDAFRGNDVTPLYIKHEPDKSQMDPDAIANFVSISNQAWLRGQYELANTLQEIVEKSLNRSLPLLSQRSGALGWHTRQDATMSQKWDTVLQRLVVRAPVIIAKSISDNIDGRAALLKSFLTPLIGRPVGHLKRSIKRFSNRLVWKWIPAEAGYITTSTLD